MEKTAWIGAVIFIVGCVTIASGGSILPKCSRMEITNGERCKQLAEPQELNHCEELVRTIVSCTESIRDIATELGALRLTCDFRV